MLAALALLAPLLSPAPQEPPSVVVIVADDLGWRDLGVEGSRFYESPRIDGIARSGVRFTQGYATCQVCSPSRASLLLGQLPARHGITDWIGAAEGTAWTRNDRLHPATYEHELPAEDVTLAEAFREAGYTTFFAGKWHLGGEGSLPEDHGFDLNLGGHHRGSPPGGYFSPYANPKLPDGPDGESLPLRLGRETAAFIDAHAERPFLAYLSFYSVHGPIQSTRERWARYRAKAAALPTPERRFVIDRTSPVRQVQDHPVYAGMIEAMDDAVGLVLDALERNDLRSRTIVVFTSDNGGVSAGDGKATSNLPLRGGKGRQWEGGLRVPFHVSAPDGIAPGTTCDVPVTGADLYPTLLELCGLPARPEQHLDGLSLVPLLRGESTGAAQALRERPLYWHYPHYGNQGGEPSSIVRMGPWKLIHYHEDGRDELYDLAADPGEQRDRAATQAERARAMRRRLDAWLASVDARAPSINGSFDPRALERAKLRTREVTLPALEAQAAGFLAPDYAPEGWWGSADR